MLPTEEWIETLWLDDRQPYTGPPWEPDFDEDLTMNPRTGELITLYSLKHTLGNQMQWAGPMVPEDQIPKVGDMFVLKGKPQGYIWAIHLNGIELLIRYQYNEFY